MEAALDLLEHHEYDQIQVRDVAEHADVALGTLYRYFSSKEHLYSAVLLEWSKPVRARDSEVDEALDADRLVNFLHRAVRAFERRPQMLRAQIAIESTTDDNARANFYNFGFRHHSEMSSTIRDAPPNKAEAIIETTNSVLATQLRYWALGLCSIDHVKAALDRTVRLIYPDDGGQAT